MVRVLREQLEDLSQKDEDYELWIDKLESKTVLAFLELLSERKRSTSTSKYNSEKFNLKTCVSQN